MLRMPQNYRLHAVQLSIKKIVLKKSRNGTLVTRNFQLDVKTGQRKYATDITNLLEGNCGCRISFHAKAYFLIL